MPCLHSQHQASFINVLLLEIIKWCVHLQFDNRPIVALNARMRITLYDGIVYIVLLTFYDRFWWIIKDIPEQFISEFVVFWLGNHDLFWNGRVDGKIVFDGIWDHMSLDLTIYIIGFPGENFIEFTGMMHPKERVCPLIEWLSYHNMIIWYDSFACSSANTIDIYIYSS